MSPLEWVRTVLDGARVALDVYRGVADHADAHKRIERIRQRGTDNALLDERLRKVARERAGKPPDA